MENRFRLSEGILGHDSKEVLRILCGAIFTKEKWNNKLTGERRRKPDMSDADLRSPQFTSLSLLN